MPAPVAGRVSIVVLNWNSGELGRRATASALAQTWADVEVVVVDNASDDDSLASILEAHPAVVLVRNVWNLGFGGGMNAGIAVATGEFVLALNCDAELDVHYVERLVPIMLANPSTGAAGGAVSSPRVGTTGPMRITATMRTAPIPHRTEMVCDKVNGACPLFRADALRSVHDLVGGPFDSSYFVYGEDVDLALTLQRLGWRYQYEPGARASHVRSFASAPRLADRRGLLRRTTLANRHRNIIRHAGGPWPALSGLALIQDVGFVGQRVVRGDLQVVSDVFNAWSDVVTSARSDVARRRSLRQASGLIGRQR